MPTLSTAPRVLVIEDNHDAAESLREILELLGCTVAVSFSGLDGIQAAQRFDPDLVLCDIGLPGLDGIGVARALRQDGRTAAAKLVALTGYGHSELRDLAMSVGFDEYIVKPARLPRLCDLVSHVQRHEDCPPPIERRPIHPSHN